MYQINTLKFEFESLNGTTLDDQGNTNLTIDNCKAAVHVSYSGNMGGFQCEVTLYGLGLELIATLSARGIGPYQSNNVQIGMKVYANDTLVFDGGIYSAYANMNQVPEVGLIISAVAGNDLMRTPASPFTATGSQPYETILNSICTANGYTLNAINLDGITGTNPHFVGDVMRQLQDACNAASLQMAVNGKVVTVWKPGDAIDSVKPLISPDYGLIGYPVFTQSGITFQTTFSTYLSQGRNVTLQTSLPNASGDYNLFQVDHYLSAWMQGGPWTSVCQGAKVITNVSE